MMLLNPMDAPPTFFHINGTVERPDHTIASNNEVSSKTSWEVLEEETMSDHQYTQSNHINVTTTYFRRQREITNRRRQVAA
ncbi:hypothetical protein AVEN_118850-1 [Araneus ventricosus]|uniref:Uncharacterized protein n=1 Tax=Araneus ventricosus TaxID=182803 RepID=A0A4Y2WJM5_ARAVE|nr:hypothetical protein AVEN_118850-1 [Araneus ventricosus]